MLKLITLQDPNDNDINWQILAETNLSEIEMEEKIKEIVNNFEKNGIWDWDYEMLVKELEKEGYIKLIEYDRYFIFI